MVAAAAPTLKDLFDYLMKQFWEMPIVMVVTILVMSTAVFWEWMYGEWEIVIQLKLARSLVRKAIAEKDCAPILLRLAWHDAGTYDKARDGVGMWPSAGGAIGSIRTKHELFAPPNAGLQNGLSKYLAPIKEQCPLVSWADLIQLAGATAVEESGGPVITGMRYGRVDGVPKDLAEPPFGLPDAKPPFGGPASTAGKNNNDPVVHLKWVFGKYGMEDKDIVALSGAHTIGRAFRDRSGAVEESYSKGTKYTAKGFTNGATGCPFLGKSETPGGKSWTKDWLVFNNSYFTGMAAKDPACVAFPTDLCLATHPDFKPHFDAFKEDQAAFFEAYAESHRKLSELGAKFDPPRGHTLNERKSPWMIDLT